MPFDEAFANRRSSHLWPLMSAITTVLSRFRLNPALELSARPVLVEIFYRNPKILERNPDYYTLACEAVGKVLADPALKSWKPKLEVPAETNSKPFARDLVCSMPCFLDLQDKMKCEVSPAGHAASSVAKWNLSNRHIGLVLGLSEVEVELHKQEWQKASEANKRCVHSALVFGRTMASVDIERTECA